MSFLGMGRDFSGDSDITVRAENNSQPVLCWMGHAYGLNTSKDEVLNQREIRKQDNSSWISRRSLKWMAAKGFCQEYFMQQNHNIVQHGSNCNQSIGSQVQSLNIDSIGEYMARIHEKHHSYLHVVYLQFLILK